MSEFIAGYFSRCLQELAQERRGIALKCDWRASWRRLVFWRSLPRDRWIRVLPRPSRNPATGRTIWDPLSYRRRIASRYVGVSEGKQRSSTSARIAGRPRPQTAVIVPAAADAQPAAANTTQHQRRNRGRISTRSHREANAGDRGGHRQADYRGSRPEDDHRHCESGGWRDGRRCARCARDLLDARLCRRPAQYALQRYLDRPVDHDRSSNGHGQP